MKKLVFLAIFVFLVIGVAYAETRPESQAHAPEPGKRGEGNKRHY